MLEEEVGEEDAHYREGTKKVPNIRVHEIKDEPSSQEKVEAARAHGKVLRGTTIEDALEQLFLALTRFAEKARKEELMGKGGA